jgi:hypothetical protein
MVYVNGAFVVNSKKTGTKKCNGVFVKAFVVVCECRELTGTYFNGVMCVELNACGTRRILLWYLNGGAADHEGKVRTNV